MMIAIMSVYLVLLFALVRSGIVTFNLFWKASPFIVLLLLNLLLFIPMGWGAPQGSALVVRNAVSIIPNVAGGVVHGAGGGKAAPRNRGVSLSIASRPHEAQGKGIGTQLKMWAARLAPLTAL